MKAKEYIKKLGWKEKVQIPITAVDLMLDEYASLREAIQSQKFVEWKEKKQYIRLFKGWVRRDFKSKEGKGMTIAEVYQEFLKTEEKE